MLGIQPGVMVPGHAVSDVVHLLAELIENATVFSASDTQVLVAVQELGSGGVLIQVSDSGVGVSEARLAEMNRRLDDSPAIDESVSRHMGLFAVARLAEWHGVRVRLRAGTPQGLTAVVPAQAASLAVLRKRPVLLVRRSPSIRPAWRWSTRSREPDIPPAPIPFGHAEPHGVYADDQEPVLADMACLMGKVTGAMITGIAADVHRYRATPPTIANTDGDPMCLITAAIAVAEGAIGKLAACPDFDLDTDEPDRGTWWDALIPGGQREARMAEAKAQLRA